jgi:cell division septation protein DedD
VSRQQLYAMLASSLLLGVLAFAVGIRLGGGRVGLPALETSPPSADAAVRPILPDEARTAPLEELLARVEARATGPSDASALRAALTVPRPGPATAPADPADPSTPAVVGTETPVVAPVVDPFPDAPPAPVGVVAAGQVQAAPASVGKVPRDGWAIDLGAVTAAADAEARVAALSGEGLAAYALPALVGGHSVWRVRIGGYTDRQAASDAFGDVKARAGVGDARVVHAP